MAPKAPSIPPERWSPRFGITPRAARALMQIEAARAVVDRTPLPPAAQAELRQRARIHASHFSTQIEGNRLTLREAEEVIANPRARFRGRERDVREVRNYWNALLRVEQWAAAGRRLTHERIQRLHALVESGRRARPTPYRDGQNSIRDAATGALVYLPPEAHDVQPLIEALLAWIDAAEEDELPAPLVAGLTHYQFVTIHPFYDGNGRTARLLATCLLSRAGYGLHGFYSLEEHYARDLTSYYRELATHPHHNYYEGRSEVDLSAWVEYFTTSMADVFNAARDRALAAAERGTPEMPETLRRLDPRARRVLALFATSDRITSLQVAHELGLSRRMARTLLKQWTEEGWLEIVEPARRNRAYGLSAIYRQFIGQTTAIESDEG